jgi:hypothetical protein
MYTNDICLRILKEYGVDTSRVGDTRILSNDPHGWVIESKDKCSRLYFGEHGESWKATVRKQSEEVEVGENGWILPKATESLYWVTFGRMAEYVARWQNLNC